MRRLSTALLAAGALSLTAAPGALTAPAEQSPIGSGPPAHYHHVHTGNGECHDIDSVRFEGGDRGLHRGANKSGAAHGPWHGTCATHTHPAPTLGLNMSSATSLPPKIRL